MYELPESSILQASSIALWQILREESWKINKISDEYIWMHTSWLLYLFVYFRISTIYCILYTTYTHHSQDNPNRHRRQDSPRPVMGLIAAATAASRSFSVLNEARVWDAAGDILNSIRYWLEKPLRKSHRPKYAKCGYMPFLIWIKGVYKDPQFMVWEKKNLPGRLSYSFYSVLPHRQKQPTNSKYICLAHSICRWHFD